MRSDLVIEALIVGGGAIGGLDGVVAVVSVPELDARGVVGAFDAAVELGPFRGQHEERDLQVFAGLLEVGAELAVAVDLGGDERDRSCARTVSRKRLALRAVARLKTRTTICLPMGETALNFFSCLLSQETDR